MIRLVRAFSSLEKKVAVRALAIAMSSDPTHASGIVKRARSLPSRATTAICIFVVRGTPGILRRGLDSLLAPSTAWPMIVLMSAGLNPALPPCALIEAGSTSNAPATTNVVSHAAVTMPRRLFSLNITCSFHMNVFTKLLHMKCVHKTEIITRSDQEIRICRFRNQWAQKCGRARSAIQHVSLHSASMTQFIKDKVRMSLEFVEMNQYKKQERAAVPDGTVATLERVSACGARCTG